MKSINCATFATLPILGQTPRKLPAIPEVLLSRMPIFQPQI